MDKLKMHSPDLSQSNISKIRALFPNCVTEVKSEAAGDNGQLKLAIDFDQLKQELSDSIVEGPQERYHLNWPGKREALLTANAPIAKTLRPCREESVNFDTTENLFIEGDNLEALKLLQETYLDKVKVIYIDPPYNTGNDYVYEDNFYEDNELYLHRSNQVDNEGRQLQTNTKSNGRFHSDWLTMMFSRIKIAHRLLRDDGVIFISIDDNESHNLKKLCDEVFGENNFISNIVWQKKFSRANDASYFSTMHDHILCYAKNSKLNGNTSSSWELNLLPRGDETPSGYSNLDDDPRGVWTSVVLSAKSGTDKLKYKITTPSGRECFPPDGRFWGVNSDKFEKLVSDNRIWFGKNGDGTPRLKTFLSEVQNGLRPNSIWFHDQVGHNQEGRQEVKKIFNDKAYFDSPKPMRLIKTILSIASSEKDYIVLDFFAGSGTTAHAVMKLNEEDGGNRKFITVQIPEPLPEKSDAYNNGYKFISDITKDRLRIATNEIQGERIGTGFRVLKIDTSNMTDVFYRPDQINQTDMFAQVENIKIDRTDEDLLFQVLLDWGVGLTLPISKQQLVSKGVFFVNADEDGEGADLIACFGKDISNELIKTLAEKQPLRVVFRDDGFANDSVKINVEQIFKQISPMTDVKSI
jgi:adenine-specific DNA-methyltransferase